MRSLLLLLSTFAIACTSFTSVQEDFVLVENGVAKSKINIPANSSTAVRNAANTLKKYLKESTGATIEIVSGLTGDNVIYLGNATAAQKEKYRLDEDGFIINKIDQSIFILGGSDWGVEYGVYAFLEKYLGVKWLMPTDKWTVIPKHSNLIIKEANSIENPKFLSRRLAPINVEGSSDEDVWGRRNRLQNKVEFNHNLYKLFPVAKDKIKRPSVYPIYNGKRYFPESINDQNWQPNFSSPQSLKIASQRIVDYFKSNGNKYSFSLSINDSKRFDEGRGRIEAHTNYLGLEDRSNEYFKWVNGVVSEVNKSFPNKRYGALAYNNTFNPPDFPLEDNVIPFITYERLKWVDSKLKTEGYQISKQWSNVAKTVGWYDYDYGFNYYLPRVWFHHMQSYLSWASENNVKYYVAEFYPNWGEGPKGWISAKLLWNPNQDVDSLLNEWYLAAFGKNASNKIKEYYSIWERFWTVDLVKSSWWSKSGIYLPYNNFQYLQEVPESYITQSDKLFDEAYNLAASSIQKERVLDLKKMWTFYKSAIYLFKNNKSVQKLDVTSLKSTGDLDKKENERYFKTFHDLLSSFKTDPLFNKSFGYWNRSNASHSSMWRLNTVTSSEEASIKPMISKLKNTSFENGKSPWGFWLSSNSKGQFEVIRNDNNRYELQVSNIKLGSFYQDFGYEAGDYIAIINYFVPDKTGIRGKLDVDLQIFNSNKKKVKNLTSTSNSGISIESGTWKRLAVSFMIKANEVDKPSFIRFKIDVKDLENSVIYFDDITVQRSSNKVIK